MRQWWRAAMVAGAMSTAGVGRAAEAPPIVASTVAPDSLVSLVTHDNYLQAFAQAQRFTQAADVAQIQAWSKDNRAPGMWLQAMHWYGQGDLQQAANWMYTALLTTRMDAAVCTGSRASQVEGQIARALGPAVNAIRSDPQRVSQAIRFAVRWQADRRNTATDPEWVCRVAVQGTSFKAHAANLTAWPRLRDRAFQTFRSMAGLGHQPCTGDTCAGITSPTPADTLEW